MLNDVLGVAIASITIILLLSLLVTALVQSSQAVLRLRARNLLKGVAALLLNQRDTTSSVSRAERRASKRDAMRVLNSTHLASSSRINPYNSSVAEKVLGPDSALRYWLVGPKVSWIDPNDLPKALDEVNLLSGKSHKKLIDEFKRLEAHNSKRFQTVARGWSFAWAMVVAFVLQVSTPALLNKLATDVPYRDRILADTDRNVAFAKESLAKINYETVAAGALDEMTRRHPDLQERIERASGRGVNREFIVDEFRLAVGVGPQDALSREYEQLLDQNAGREDNAQTRQILDRLSVYNIGVWQSGWDFYYRKAVAPRMRSGSDSETVEEADAVAAISDPPVIVWPNVIGVLMTSILLSLGAPFWFERLRNIANFRDLLSGKSKAEDGTAETPGAEKKN